MADEAAANSESRYRADRRRVMLSCRQHDPTRPGHLAPGIQKAHPHLPPLSCLRPNGNEQSDTPGNRCFTFLLSTPRPPMPFSFILLHLTNTTTPQPAGTSTSRIDKAVSSTHHSAYQRSLVPISTRPKCALTCSLSLLLPMPNPAVSEAGLV